MFKENDTEPFLDQNDASTRQVLATLEPSQPKGPGKGLIFAGIAAVCVAAAVVGVRFFSTVSPKAAVAAAFVKTVAAQKAANEKLYDKIPAAKPLFQGLGGAQTTEFDLKIQSVEDVPYAALASTILKNGGVSGQMSNDPANKIAAFDGAVYLRDADLVGLSLFASPDLVTGNLPTFSSTVLSFNPETLAQDYPGSALGAVYPLTPHALAAIQGVISGEIEYISALGNLSPEKLLADIAPIFKNALKNADYSYDKTNKVYLMSIPGADLKNAVLDYYRYVYFDSDFSPAVEKMLAPTLSAESGMSYEDTMNQMVDAIGASLPEMNALMTLAIDNGLIKAAQLSCLPVEGAQAQAGAATVERIAFDCTFEENQNTAKMVIDVLGEGGQKQTMLVNATGLMGTDTYTLDMAAEVTADTVSLNIPINLRIAADGSYHISADMALKADGQPLGAGFVFDGTAVLKDKALTVSLPGARIYGSAPQLGTAALVFDLSSKSSALAQPIAAPEQRTALFEMDAQQLERLGDEYSVGAETLVGRLYSLLMR